VPETLEQAILVHPEDIEARYRLGAARLMHDDYGGVGRNGLLALFSLLGEQDVRTQRYRTELLNVAS